MDRIYRVLLIAVCGVGILFALQYFLPITAQILHIPGIVGIPGLPSMPTIAYEPTVETLPLVTLQPLLPTPTTLFATAPAIPGATLAGTSTGTATITLTPAPGVAQPSATRRPATATGQPQKTATSAPTTGGPTATSGSVSQNPCANVLYQVKKGNAWTYRISAQGRSLDVNMIVSDVSGQRGVIDVYNRTTGAVSSAMVECDNGAILNFPWVIGGMFTNSAAGGGVDVRYVSGVLAPSLATFESNNWNLSWSGNYRLTGTASAPFQGQNFDVILNDSPLTLNCQTAGFEKMTVQAGTADRALKVVCNGQSQVTGTVNGLTVSGTVTGQSTQWFAYEGLMKMRVDSASFNVFGISLPLNLNGGIELLGFQLVP